MMNPFSEMQQEARIEIRLPASELKAMLLLALARIESPEMGRREDCSECDDASDCSIGILRSKMLASLDAIERGNAE